MLNFIKMPLMRHQLQYLQKIYSILFLCNEYYQDKILHQHKLYLR